MIHSPFHFVHSLLALLLNSLLKAFFTTCSPCTCAWVYECVSVYLFVSINPPMYLSLSVPANYLRQGGNFSIVG